MSPFGLHPPHLVDSIDTLFRGPALTRDSVVFFRFFLFLCPSVCLHVTQSFHMCAIYSKYFRSYYNY